MRGTEVGLALQGGGAYAAFTAGVLKTLLNRKRRFLPADRIRSISGTSGGALNALALGLALHEGDRDIVRYLDRLWEFNRVERIVKEYCAPLHLIPDGYVEALIGLGRRFTETSPHLSASIGETARANRTLNKLIERLLRTVAPTLPEANDVSLLPARRPYVTVAATEVRTGIPHFFTNNGRMVGRFGRLGVARRHQMLHDLTLDGVLASAAHPGAFAPVTIGENVYWDGYLTSNPPFTYLFREGCEEVVLIRLVPPARKDVGSDRAFIRDRTEEIVQTSTLSKEIEAYFAMRELWVGNPVQLKGVRYSVGMRRLDDIGVYHEIRLNKPGNIAEQAYPFSRFVDKLLYLGEKVVADRNGFIATYRQAGRGLQIVSHVDFESERVESEAIDLDALMAADILN